MENATKYDVQVWGLLACSFAASGLISLFLIALAGITMFAQWKQRK